MFVQQTNKTERKKNYEPIKMIVPKKGENIDLCVSISSLFHHVKKRREEKRRLDLNEKSERIEFHFFLFTQ